MKGPVVGRSNFANGVLSPKSTAAPRPLATPRGRAGADMPEATPDVQEQSPSSSSQPAAKQPDRWPVETLDRCNDLHPAGTERRHGANVDDGDLPIPDHLGVDAAVRCSFESRIESRTRDVHFSTRSTAISAPERYRLEWTRVPAKALRPRAFRETEPEAARRRFAAAVPGPGPAPSPSW